MTEDQLTDEILRLATQLGLLAHHCSDSRRCKGPKGFPDLILVGIRGILFVELKNDDSGTSPEQDLWGWAIIKAGEYWCVWRPADLASGAIAQRLAMLSKK